MTSLEIKISTTDIPGLVNAVLVDSSGVVIETFPELTMGQVHYVADRRAVQIRPVGLGVAAPLMIYEDLR